MRYKPSSGELDVCATSAGVAATPQGGTAAKLEVGVIFSATGAMTVKTSANVNAAFMALPLPPAAPPPGQAVFQTVPGQGQFCWVYNSTNVPRPSTPPPGAPLPGAWVLVRPHYWVWYPQPGVLTVINTYFVSSNGNQAMGFSGPGQSALTAPTLPPPTLANVPGSWIRTNPFYWVYVPTTSAALAAPAPATSSSWLWWLLGIGVVGGVGYYLLD